MRPKLFATQSRDNLGIKNYQGKFPTPSELRDRALQSRGKCVFWVPQIQIWHMGGRGRPRWEAEGGRGRPRQSADFEVCQLCRPPVVTQPYFFMRFRQVGLGPGRVSNDGIGDHRGTGFFDQNGHLPRPPMCRIWEAEGGRGGGLYLDAQAVGNFP